MSVDWCTEAIPYMFTGNSKLGYLRIRESTFTCTFTPLPTCTCSMNCASRSVRTAMVKIMQSAALYHCCKFYELAQAVFDQSLSFFVWQDERHNFGSNVTGWIIGLLSLTQLIVCPIFGKVVSKCFYALK